MQDGKNVADAAAITGGHVAAFAAYADVVTPLLSVTLMLLSIAWVLWRMFDRWKHGPRVGGGD